MIALLYFDTMESVSTFKSANTLALCQSKATLPMRMSIYSYTFKSVIFESVILESVKLKIFSKSVKMIQIITFLRISENDTFETAILESVSRKST